MYISNEYIEYVGITDINGKKMHTYVIGQTNFYSEAKLTFGMCVSADNADVPDNYYGDEGIGIDVSFDVFVWDDEYDELADAALEFVGVNYYSPSILSDGDCWAELQEEDSPDDNTPVDESDYSRTEYILRD